MIPAPKQEHLAPGTMAEGTICVHPEWAMIRDIAEDPALGNHSGEEGKTMREEAKTKTPAAAAEEEEEVAATQGACPRGGCDISHLFKSGQLTFHRHVHCKSTGRTGRETHAAVL